MKPALHYSIRHDVFGGPRVVAVTLQRRLRWWGRYHDTSETTHGRAGDLDGEWATPEEARAKMTEVRRVRDHFSRQRSALRQAEERLRQAETTTIKNVVNNHPHRDLPTVRAVVRNENQMDAARDELAALLRRIASEGTPGLEEGRSLDAALDAILASAGVL